MGIEISLESQVKYTNLTLTKSILNQVIGLRIVTQPTLSRIEAKIRCLAEFAHPQRQAYPHNCPT